MRDRIRKAGILVVLLFALVTPALAVPITFTQSNYAAPQTPQATVAVPFTATQTAGNTNIIVVGWNDATSHVQSVTDTKGNIYLRAVGPTVQSGIATQSIYYAKNILAAAVNANTVTVTFDAAARYVDICVAEYSGLDPVNALDVSVGAQGSGTMSDSGMVTTTNPKDLLIGANLVQTQTTGPGSGYTSRVISNPDGDIFEDRVVTATGSYGATALVSSGGAWIMQMVAFRAAGTTPNISSLNPASGAVGTSVTIAGVNFGASPGTSTMKFNGTTATPTSWSATSIVAPVPSGATTGNVVVTVSGMASNGVNFTVQSATASITFIQSNYLVPQTPQATVAVPFTATQTAGNINIIVVAWRDSTSHVQSVTDTRGNIYVRAVGPTVQSGTATQSIYYAKSIVASAANPNSVTVTFDAAAPYVDMRIAEYSGMDPVNALDVSIGAQGTSATSDSGAMTTTNANDLLVGANLVHMMTTGPGTGYSIRVISNPDGDVLEDRVVAATASYGATAPVSPTGAWIMQMIAFRAAGSPVILNTPPSITTQPASQTVIAGQTATLSVMVTGTAPLSYQWRKNGVAITGATSSAIADSGAPFTVVVSNSAGSVSSNAGILTVTAATRLLSASPSSVSFGSVTVSSSTLLAVTLTNSGNSSVSISGVSLSGVGFSASGVSTGQMLNPGQTATLNVTFAPALTGSVIGNVAVASNASNSPAAISLSGLGVSHFVSLLWTPSTSIVVGYNVYSGTVSGGPYAKLTSVPIPLSSYIDASVLSGRTYYYVVPAIDSSAAESARSNEARAAIP
jgi:IPT/TIG domain/Abnormal spindle-like microcephaly-assoc'd, ASPM-SPD-2-Hydin/Immunoglobulin domain